ncbi:hypothetical protein CYY_008157 [Polysphondylium violaceum]|uniref:Phosphoglycerate mutase family protein n=1 Tax=Polysphondylium violaceum TaxID=133409 RepID=A0A8J4PNJ7_9MYCE|nr:hypothetical protein CYY_008157 [Polysphondylium violaceum]
MVIITFVRHGETDFNKNGILQGHLNIPLNSKGRQQAEEVGKQLARDTPINLIITSDLDRAYETATIIHDSISLSSTIPIISTQLLRERNLGKLEGVDLRQLVNWEELPEPKRLIEIQKLLSRPEVDINDFKNENDNNDNIVEDMNNSNNNTNDIEYTNSLASSTNSLSSVSSVSSSSSSSSSSSYDNPNSLSSSTSSLTSVDIPISLTSSSTPTNVKLSSNILKLLPSRELKMETKSHLISRAKEAFQFILKQIPSKYINNSSVDSLSTNFLTNIFSSNNNSNSNQSVQTNNNPSAGINFANLPKDFHILIVSHSVMLRTILSLLLCKKPVPFFQSPNDRRVTQSESSSIQNFKWIKCELKNASSIRTTFNVIEKKRDSIKRIPRDVVFIHSSDSTT